jgi:hypothetical protein
MLKIPAQYDRDTTSAKLNGFCSQFPASLLGALTREIWLINQKLLEFRWGRTRDHKMASVHGMLCAISPSNSNQKPSGHCSCQWGEMMSLNCGNK